jgi:hypothetical protein
LFGACVVDRKSCADDEADRASAEPGGYKFGDERFSACIIGRCQIATEVGRRRSACGEFYLGG